MEYHVEYDADRGVCTVTVTGPHQRPHDSEELQRFARKFGRERNCRRFLFDMTRAEIHAQTMDTFATGTVRVDTDYSQRVQRIALVYADRSADQRFLETVACNRGYQVQVFDNVDDAMTWLVTNPQDNWGQVSCHRLS